MEIRCEECDIIFEKKTKNQRYCCPKCKRAGGRRKARERYYQTEKYLSRQRAKEKQTLADINSKAREAGMTYGKYMAQEYGKLVKVERRKEK